MKNEVRWRCVIYGKFNSSPEDICEKCKPIAIRESEGNK